MSKISHTQPSQHGNITQWTHMEEMKWSSSGMLGGLAANDLGVSLALAEICQTFGKLAVLQGHGMSKISHTQPA